MGSPVLGAVAVRACKQYLPFTWLTAWRQHRKQNNGSTDRGGRSGEGKAVQMRHVVLEGTLPQAFSS